LDGCGAAEPRHCCVCQFLAQHCLFETELGVHRAVCRFEADVVAVPRAGAITTKLRSEISFSERWGANAGIARPACLLGKLGQDFGPGQ
jgi:hypothetical protein